jgi:hypothetical protein
MVSPAAATDKPAFEASRCLSFPGSHLAPPSQNTATLRPSQRLTVFAATVEVSSAPITLSPNTVVYRACPKRGPPLLVLSLNEA